jgi:basic membrane protein A and related proteins
VAGLAAVLLLTVFDNGASNKPVARSQRLPSQAITPPFKACLATNSAGIADKSLNQATWAGFNDAQSAGKTLASYLPSIAARDYRASIGVLEHNECGLIVTVGAAMAKATIESAKLAPSQHFVIVDSPGNGSNVQGLVFNVAQSAFQAGFLAAGYSKSGVVATYGGTKSAPTTLAMDGFWDGVQYYNSNDHGDVQVLGWNEKTQTGTFIGSVTDRADGSSIAREFMSDGADVIYPVAGQAALGTASAVKSANNGTSLIWTGEDGCVSEPQYCGVFLTTTTEFAEAAVEQIIEAAAAGTVSSVDYLATLANKGVGLAPYHQFASHISASLQGKIAAVGQGIVSGTITVSSPSQP